MWTSLRDQRQIEFYENAERGAGTEREDWKPMIRVVRALQEQEYASSLFAFTSLMHFHITTASDYATFDEASQTVCITWAWPIRRFHLRHHKGSWIADGPPQHVCREAGVLAAVRPMIAGMLESSRQQGRSDA